MFRRVITESWHDWAPAAAFAITFGVFVFAFARAILLRQKHIDRLAQLPLENDPPNPPAKP